MHSICEHTYMQCNCSYVYIIHTYIYIHVHTIVLASQASFTSIRENQHIHWKHWQSLIAWPDV